MSRVRITQLQLERLCNRINSQAGTPSRPYERDEQGQLQPQAHAYLLDCAYGGVDLRQMGAKGTGERSVLGGHFPKREAFNRMQSYLTGLRDGQGAK